MNAVPITRRTSLIAAPGRLVGGLVLVCCLSGLAAATTYRVDGLNGNDANGGTTWDTDALQTIQGAITKAANGDEIWVRTGTYVPTSQGSFYAIVVDKTVAIYGGFAGTETLRSERNPRTYTTTVDCYSASGDGHGFYVHPAAAPGAVVIDGFNIIGGLAYGSGYHAWGGGIGIRTGTVIIANCSTTYCEAYRGGGINITGEATSVTVVNCTLRNNTAMYYGGGIDTSLANTVITNCELSGNSVYSGGGGGIGLWGGGSILNCTVAVNTTASGSPGAGVYGYQQGTTQIKNSIIWGNNMDGAPSEIALAGSAAASVSYSDVRGGYAGTGNVNQDPLFVQLAAEGDFRVQPFSPCVDGGSNAALPADVADLDQDGDVGETLPLDLAGQSRTTTTVDMGAREYVPGSATLYTLTVVIDPSPSGSVTGSGIACPGTCTRDYIAGSQVTLSATTDASGIFDNWDDWNTDSTYQFTLTDDQTVTAHFTLPQPGLALEVTPESCDFGDVSPESCGNRQVTIRNIGTDALILGELAPPAAPFALETDPCSGVTLTTGQLCTVEVSFCPNEDDYGSFASNFEIPFNDPLTSPFTVQLAGRVFRDADGDDVADMDEQGPTGVDPGYDGNQDGTPDWLQDNAVSLPRAAGEGEGYVTFAVASSTGHFSRASASPLSSWLEDPEYPDPPANVSLLQGVYWFSLNLEAGVSSATVMMYLPAGSYPSRYYQFDDAGEDSEAWHWYEFGYDGQTGATNAGNVITLHFVDGLRGDSNLEEPDGEIQAEGGPAWRSGDDDDADGVPSVNDNCPFTFNPNQHDVDGDGVGDLCDGCPNDPGKTDPGTCGCGVPDVDSDGDGALDCLDGCPDDRTMVLPGACGCGQPETDTDADGVPDCVDNCPDLANPDQADADSDGVGDACTPDPDEDGVTGDVEGGAPNDGDGNNDGIPDSEQPHVASLPSTSGDYVSLVVPEGLQLVAVAAIANPSPADVPPDGEFPVGFLSFAIQGLEPGAAVAVQIILHAEPAPEITGYWKYGPTPDAPGPHWYEFLYDGSTGAEISGNIITLHFTDGARGDADLLQNGVIADPGAPSRSTGWNDDSGLSGCGAGACGAGIVGYVPVSVLGICCLKLRRRWR